MKAQQLKQIVLKNISDGTWRAGSRMGSAVELAQKHQIPLISVNRLLTDLAADGYLKRVKGQGTFVATPPESSRKLNIGLAFLHDYHGSTLADFSAFGIMRYHAEKLLEDSRHNFSHINFYDLKHGTMPETTDYDALILAASFLDNDTMPRLLSYNIPIIVLQHSMTMNIPFAQVIPDVVSGFHQAAQFLRCKGITRINMLSSTEDTAMQRVDVFRNAARWAGFADSDISHDFIPLLRGDNGQLAGYRLGSQLVKKLRPDECIFSPSDFFSFGLMSSFMEHRLTPGEDFHLLSFDNLEEESFCPLGSPMLTTIDFPKRAIVDRAVQMAIAMALSPDDRELMTVAVPASLIIRNSCNAKKITRKEKSPCLK